FEKREKQGKRMQQAKSPPEKKTELRRRNLNDDPPLVDQRKLAELAGYRGTRSMWLLNNRSKKWRVKSEASVSRVSFDKQRCRSPRNIKSLMNEPAIEFSNLFSA
ncbi:MAG: hypothetical protein KJZ52_12690, partial [Anaerolineales bacterium]|nr:hypothetical protein [Anaerolineales bacterium]